MAGPSVLWQAWEAVAASDLPVVHLFAPDDNDIPISDMLRLKAILDGRAAEKYTRFFSGTGGHAFFAQSEHLAHMFTLVGQVLKGPDYVSSAKPAYQGSVAGF